MGKEIKKTTRRRVKKSISSADKGLEIVHKEQEKRDKNNKKRSKVVKSKTEKKIKKIKQEREVKKSSKNVKVIAIIVSLIVLSLIYNNYHKLGIVFTKNINISGAKVITRTSSNNIIKEYRDEILVYSSGTYTTYNKYGKETWEKKLDTTFVPEIATAGKYIQIINKNNGYVYLYNNKYESARIKIDGTIKSGIITEDGMSIIEYSKAGAKTILGVYNKNGNEEYKIKLNSNTISQYVMSSNSNYLAYSEVIIDGISLSTNINIVDLSKANDETYTIPTLITKENELSYKMFFNGNKLIVLFENGAAVLSASSGKVSEFKIPNVNLLNLDIGTNKYSYVSLNSKKTSGYILSLLKFGDIESKDVLLKEAPIEIIYKNDLVYVVYKKQVSIYNSFEMNIKNYTSDTILTTPTIFNSGKSVAVPTSNKIIVFTI